MNRVKSDFLCAPSSFASGFGTVLDVGGRHFDYNASEDPDSIAIANDWRIVGQDIRDVLDRARSEFDPAVWK